MLTHNQRIAILVIAVAGLLIVLAGLHSRIKRPIPVDRAFSYPQQEGLGAAIGGAPAPAAFMGRDIASKIVPEPAPGGTASLDEVTREDRLIIRSGNFGVVVEDVGKSVRELSTVATELGGFVVSSSIDTSDGVPVERERVADGGRLGFATLRIPVERFSEAMDRVRALGRVVSESVTGQDVTEEFVDAEARLKNLRASEAQFLEIMRRATKVEDVLQVQQQLERVRGEIEQTQGRIQYLERSAKLATIQVSLSTDEGELPIVDPADRWRPSVIMKQAFRSLVALFQGLGTLLLWIVIFIPVWVPLALLLWWLRRRQSRPAKKS